MDHSSEEMPPDHNPFTPRVLKQFIGQEVNVFGPRTCEEHENCLGGGFLSAIEDGFLLLSEKLDEPVDLAISLQEATVIAVIKDRPELTSVEGGKVYRFRRNESSEPKE